LAEITGLTRASVSHNVSRLIDRGFVKDGVYFQDKVRSGRKEISLEIQSGKYCIPVLNMSRMCIEGALYDINGEQLAFRSLEKGIFAYSESELKHQTVTLIRKLLSEYSGTRIIPGIGVSGWGSMNQDIKGMPFKWQSLHLKEYIQESFDIPVFMDNNSNLACLAEQWFGHGKGISDFCLYSIGIGVGAGVVLNGELYRGNNNTVCEVGHLTVDPGGVRCYCGNIGCLEAETSPESILKAYYEVKKKKSVIPNQINDQLIECRRFFEAAQQGDPDAISILESKGELLGIGAAALINLFSPTHLVITTNDFDEIDISPWKEILERHIRRRSFYHIADKVNISFSDLGNESHLLGCLALVMNETLWF